GEGWVGEAVRAYDEGGCARDRVDDCACQRQPRKRRTIRGAELLVNVTGSQCHQLMSEGAALFRPTLPLQL
ncbi:MAG: hypothetical protein V4447_05310, partial [Pseudomonadota bacterium]